MDNSIRRSIVARIDALADDLITVSHAIHAKPELAFKEHFACELLSRTLSEHDLPVTTGVYSLETSFETTLAGARGPTVALLAEYDAKLKIEQALAIAQEQPRATVFADLLHRLDDQPLRRATIADITCDSDGKIDQFIDLPLISDSVDQVREGTLPLYGSSKPEEEDE